MYWSEIVFDVRIVQWGLRGDPHLWEEIKKRLYPYPLPEDTAVFEELLQQLYAELTGIRLGDAQDIYIKSFDQGGMSGGYVSGRFWKEKALPILLERFNSMQKGTLLG